MPGPQKTGLITGHNNHQSWALPTGVHWKSAFIPDFLLFSLFPIALHNPTWKKSFHVPFVCLFTFWNWGVVFLLSSSKSSDVHSSYTVRVAVYLQCTLHYTSGTLHFGLGCGNFCLWPMSIKQSNHPNRRSSSDWYSSRIQDWPHSFLIMSIDTRESNSTATNIWNTFHCLPHQ